MTIQFEDYFTQDLMNQGKKTRHDNGWVPLHTDFINNKESDGYHVTFVNGLDDPDNDPILVAERVAQKIERDRVQELSTKFEIDGTLSQTELMEFLKLKLVKGK